MKISYRWHSTFKRSTLRHDPKANIFNLIRTLTVIRQSLYSQFNLQIFLKQDVLHQLKQKTKDDIPVLITNVLVR